MTRVLLDTNVVFSALLFPASVPAQALSLVIAEEHQLVFTQWVLVEPANVASAVAISDPNDQPILDAAIAAAVDVIVTGDKRFHALDVETPRILTARGFIENYPPPG